MARLRGAPKDVLQRNLPEKDKLQLALQWLRNNPTEEPHSAARIWHLAKPNTLQKKWKREKEKAEKLSRGEKIQHGGQNKILNDAQEKAILLYAVDQATNGGKGATKQMLYNCAMWYRKQSKKDAPSWKWFQIWLRNRKELHTIKTKPIASHRVDMHTEQTLRDWFYAEYLPALQFCGIKEQGEKHRIKNMDEKGARICMPAGEEVVVPIGIKEIYTGIPENRLSVTIIESISADGTAIPPVIIIPGKMIMAKWFSEELTGHELLTVSESGYTNEGIMMIWLDHFIKHNNCGPDKEWVILLLDGCLCHEASAFVIKAKANRIWLVKYPSHQTHLLQPLDVGCFRQWKRYQQVKVMDAIRSFEPEYNLSSFLRDLKSIRANTFKISTIKHSFRDSGMWPLSFDAIKRKLKEYGKKQKKDTGLEFLEYGRDSSPESEGDDEDQEPLPPMDTRLEQELTLPKLPQAPTSYADCVYQWEEIDTKIRQGLSSPTRAKFEVTRAGTETWLWRGSLDHMDVERAQASQVAFHKKSLTNRVSLQKGGSLLASVGLEKQQKRETELRIAALNSAKNKLKSEERKIEKELLRKGIDDRKAERERKKWVSDQYDLHAAGIVASIPAEKLLPIRDRQKNPTPDERENDQIRLQPFRDAVAKEQAEYDEIISKDLIDFGPEGVPIDPQILEEERAFRIKQNPLSAIKVVSDNEEEDEDILPSSPLEKMTLERGVGEEGDNVDLCSSPPKSVASIDSIAGNKDYVRFQ